MFQSAAITLTVLLFTVFNSAFALPVITIPRPRPIPVPIPAPNPKEVYFPSAKYSSLQAAVDEVANKGVVHIGPGSYQESLVLSGKEITIRGDGQNRNLTEIRFTSPALASLKGKATLVLENLTLTALGASTLVASESLNGNTEKPSLYLTKIVVNGATVAGTFKTVVMEMVQVKTNTQVGISLQGVSEAVLKTVDVNAGIEIKTKDKCVFKLNLVGVINSSVPGIYLHGPLCEGEINMVRVQGAHKAGVEVDEVKKLKFQNSSVLKTQASLDNRDHGKWGDGVLVRFSDVLFDNNVIDESRRAGISVFGCADFAPAIARLKNNRIFRSAFDMDVETQEHPFMIFLRAQGKSVKCNGGGQLQDLNDNVCGAPGAEKPCKAASSTVEPLPPPDRP